MQASFTSVTCTLVVRTLFDYLYIDYTNRISVVFSIGIVA